MNQIFLQIERLQLLHKLIDKEQTGTPEEFAKLLQISRRQLYNLIEELGQFGVEIKYNRIRQTFYFTQPLIFNVKVLIRPLTDEEMLKNNGGTSIIFIPCKIIAQSNLNFVSVILYVHKNKLQKNILNINFLN